jgi:colicin import membrane protein
MNDFRPDRRPYQKPPRRFLSFVLTVVVHIGLATFLYLGVDWDTKELGTLEVGLVGAPSAPAPAPAPAPPPPPPEPPKPEPEPEPKPEPPPKPEIATKEPEKKPEKKPEPKKPEPEKKPEPKPEPKPKPPEPLKPIDLQKQLEQKLDQEKKRLDEAEKASKLLGDGQQGTSNQRAANPGNPGELDVYINAIKAKVRRNLTLPPGLSGNPSAEFEIEQVMSSRGGQVINVRLRKSSGNRALDEAIERAIYMSDPLPPPDNPALFRRSLGITFRPLKD